jgi:predicted RNA methylase
VFYSPSPTPRKSKNEVPSKGPKIIVQYRAKGARVYEIGCLGAVISLQISTREDAAGTGNWHVAAHSVGADQVPGVEATGVTAAEALTNAATAWTSAGTGRTAFDWDAVAKELRNVQAI